MMTRRRIIFSWVFFFLIASVAAQQKWPNTLLWRITGNGLARPSYVYGTMHLQDKRLFNFGDSLYSVLEGVEGFALEVDFKEFMDSMFSKGLNQAQDSFLEEQKVKINKNKLDKSADSVFKKLGISKEHVSKKDLKKIRDYRISKLLQRGEMPTIVDGYLFGIALRQGKWTGGIEDVSDQLNLFDEMGADLTPEKVLAPESHMQKGLEQMMQLYVQQDLQGINVSINGYDAESRDVILIQRNIKMARRMDSLSARRTMFYAIGVAHLPGDSGVISLLRKKGFSVEPVYSSRKIAADIYAKRLEAIPWHKIEDNNKLYSVEMPGQASDFNMLGENMKMKMFFDLTRMSFYMTTQTIGKFNNSKDFDAAFQAMAERMGASARSLTPKNVSRNGIQGREASFEKDAILFRLQLLQKDNSLFILATGTLNKAHLYSEDANRFFSSFTPYAVAAENKDWIKFGVPEKAFSIMLPAQPKRNTLIDKNAEGSSWNFTSYDYVDNARGLYYLIQIKDIKEGYYLTGDSVYFDAFVKETRTRMDTVLRAETTSFMDFPAFYFDALYNKNVIYKTFHVTRGNRIYTLMIGGAAGSPIPEADKLFHSLVFEDYEATEWKKREGHGFFTMAPASIQLIKTDDTTQATQRQQFVSYNDKEAISYQVFKDPISSFYWVQNDSTFFSERINAYKHEGDSVLKNETTWNGSLKGAEILVQNSGSHLLKQVRLFINGDTLYSLLAFIPRHYIGSPVHQKFFSGFRIDKELAPTIYSNKADALLLALKTKDSASFVKAVEGYKSISFTKQDLFFLHRTLLEVYNDSTEYNSIQDVSIRNLKELGDTSTIHFVSEQYPLLSGEKEKLRYGLLQVLASIKTKESYTVLKNLLLKRAPQNGEASSLPYLLADSMELATSLYPQILELSTDSVFTKVLVKLTDRLLDSNLLSITDILPYKNNFLQQAMKDIAQLRQDGENWWSYSSWIPFLQKFNIKETNGLLQEFLGLPVSGLKYEAAIALVKNGQTVPTNEMKKIGADKNYRASLYNELQKLKKLSLFPQAFARPESLAESEIYGIASDDYDIASILFLGEKITVDKGKKKKFYLFKIDLAADGENESYLGVAGPYKPDAREFVPFTQQSGLYWEEQFNKAKVTQQFKNYLDQFSASE